MFFSASSFCFLICLGTDAGLPVFKPFNLCEELRVAGVDYNRSVPTASWLSF
jgi:hypothetical protein